MGDYAPPSQITLMVLVRVSWWIYDLVMPIVDNYHLPVVPDATQENVARRPMLEIIVQVGRTFIDQIFVHEMWWCVMPFALGIGFNLLVLWPCQHAVQAPYTTDISVTWAIGAVIWMVFQMLMLAGVFGESEWKAWFEQIQGLGLENVHAPALYPLLRVVASGMVRLGTAYLYSKILAFTVLYGQSKFDIPPLPESVETSAMVNVTVSTNTTDQAELQLEAAPNPASFFDTSNLCFDYYFALRYDASSVEVYTPLFVFLLHFLHVIQAKLPRSISEFKQYLTSRTPQPYMIYLENYPHPDLKNQTRSDSQNHPAANSWTWTGNLDFDEPEGEPVDGPLAEDDPDVSSNLDDLNLQEKVLQFREFLQARRQEHANNHQNDHDANENENNGQGGQRTVNGQENVHSEGPRKRVMHQLPHHNLNDEKE
eukprot:TRINITY_DN9276_c0_g1::TRINITY_DN9276_c0_g1_i1::g.13306::m.13306 TRINITY_DN9276_c0_g1::TRINITY_DN9276_c0_g1_i1::g.13306  ORF type:complete len:491 (-),score=88.53 TRINITY_DN9276_c0_g1_i1:149-1423(-)